MQEKKSFAGIVVIPFVADTDFKTIACLQDSSHEKPLWKFPAGKLLVYGKEKETARQLVCEEIGKLSCNYEQHYSFIACHRIDVSHLKNTETVLVFTMQIPRNALAIDSQFTSPKGYTVRSFAPSQVLNRQNSFLNRHRDYLQAALDSMG